MVSGAIVAGPVVRNACKRHLVDLEHGAKRGLRFDEAKADYALNFYPLVLRLNGGQFEGKPFELDPSQAFIVGSIFGWVREDGRRRFQVAYIEEGKGNGKSPLAAGIGLLCTIGDHEPRAEVYAAATKRDQAMVLMRDAVAMWRMSPALFRALYPTGRGDKVWSLYHAQTGSSFKIISNDDGQSGPRPSCGLLDEVHEHKTNYTIEMMRAGFKTRRQPLIVMITNSGSDPNSPCGNYHQYAADVNEGTKEDDSFFGYVCALDEGDEPFEDETCWPKANPLLGRTIDHEYLRKQVHEARGMPSKEAIVRRLNFCQWTQAHNPLLSVEVWDGSKAKFKLEKLRGCSVWIGIDLSSTQDLTAAVLVAKIDGLFWWWPLFWLPHELLHARAKKDKQPYDAWLKAGYIRTTPGKAINKDFVVADIAKIVDEYELSIVESAYDRWRIEELKAACDREGVELNLVEHGQGFQGMAPAIDAVETSLVDGAIRQNGNPCMRMCVANAVAASDPAGNRKFDKQKVTGRIDGIVAGAMAHGRAVATAEEGDINDFIQSPVIAGARKR